MPQAISATGSAILGGTSAGIKTLSLNPTAVGNIYIFQIIIESGTAGFSPSAVTGGNCTWTKLGNIVGSSDQISHWMGIATATGTSTVTLTSSGSGSLFYDLMAQQFTCVGVSASTVWAVDGTPGTKSNASSTTVTYPTLVPSSSGRLYVGGAFVAQTGKTTGATSGYTAVLDSETNILIYDTSVSTSQSPTATQSPAGTSSSVGALIFATNPSGIASLRVVNFGALSRASFY